MAEEEGKKRGGRYCAARGPNFTSCKNSQFTIHVTMLKFPSEPVRREKWTKFVRRHWPGWNPSKTSHLCSMHFEDSCFEHRPWLSGDSDTPKFKKFLLTTAIPPRDIVVPCKSPDSKRKRRKVSRSSLQWYMLFPKWFAALCSAF